MKHLIKTVSFLAIMTVIPGAFAATSRAGVVGQAASRRISISGYMRPVSIVGGTVVGSTTGTLGVSECMDEYSKCVRQEDVCGENFEECTTNVLFHLQMPKCDSVLLSCNASGVSMLFGPGAQFNATSNNLSTVDNYVEGSGGKEVENYIYPKPDSKLGDWIQTAWKVNSLNAQQCSKKYTSCLNRDSVCGADFELCTSKKAFKKQAVFCASTLARCSVDGKKALFGSVDCANKLGYNCEGDSVKDSIIEQLIIAGAGLAAGNAVNTCYKVADQCILKACGKNPARCTIDKANAAAEMLDYVENKKSVPMDKLAEWADRITTRDKKTYIRDMCQETIGGNKYCYMTYVANNTEYKTEDGKVIKPESFEDLVGKLSEFERQELYDDVYDDIYKTRINGTVGQRIADLMAEYDAKTRDKCLDTIRSCVMQTCGGGVGSVCYSQVFKNGSSKHINAGKTYEEIKQGCQALINSDPNCQYSAVVSGEDGYWTLGTSDDTFSAVFPAEGGTDLFGAVTALEGELATSYNDAAIAKMKKQCANTAISCVKAMCGKDYSNCFRNRTDITAGIYDTGSGGFDASMNKQAGILDYNIVTGLCINTIKNAKVCEEHLKIEANKYMNTGSATSWGDNNSVRSGWLGSADNITVGSGADDVVIGCRVDTENAVSDDCKNNTIIGKCDTMDDDGCLYDQPVTQSQGDYLYSNAANTLFQETLIDLEKEAQAKYSAKLTKEQNICLGNNRGGIKGASDNGSAFMWVKLKSGNVPGSYPQKGLKASQIIASNDIYGSFCRAKITVLSDDKAINEKLGEKATAYFAVGDAFECGSWIDKKTMSDIEKVIRDGAGMSDWKKKTALAWSTVGGALLGTGAGALVGNYLANGQIGSGGGLLNSDAKVEANNKTNAGSCVNNLEKCLDSTNNATACRAGLRDARAAGINVDVNWRGTTSVTKTCKEDVSGNVVWCPQSNTNLEAWCKDGINGLCCKKETDGTIALKHTNACVDTDRKVYAKNDNIDLTVAGNVIDDTAKTAIEAVLQECRNKVQNNNSSGVATGVGAAIGAVTGGLLGFGISKTVVDAKDAQDKDKAVAEWQETMGEHIRCYVGGEDVGGYGDYVSFNFEEMN